MSELRLAAVDGEQTQAVDRDPVMQHLSGMAFAIQEGHLNVDKLIIVATIDGRVDWSVAGNITLAEAIGLLTMASRAIERNHRSD